MDRATIMQRIKETEERVWLEEYHIAEQKRIIDQLERGGNDPQVAKEQLARFEELLGVFLAEREQLKLALAKVGLDQAKPAT